MAKNVPMNKAQNEAAVKKYSSEAATAKKASAKNTGGAIKKTVVDKKKKKLIERVGKIDRLPKNVRDSLPFNSITNDGCIETAPGHFCRCYKLPEINFSIAHEDFQEHVYEKMQEILDSFPDNMTWQFCIFNHNLDRRKLMENIRVCSQVDSLNYYRQEYNKILLEHMQKEGNSITQDKYLIVSVYDINAENALRQLLKFDGEINRKFRSISDDKVPCVALDAKEYLTLLYKIYNRENDYNPYTAAKDFDLDSICRHGGSIKDFVGPHSINFSKAQSFMLGDTYAASLYLDKMPSGKITSDFLHNLASIPEEMLISMTYEKCDKQGAIKLVKNQMTTIDARVAKIQERNSQSGIYGLVPPELERSQECTRELLEDLTSNDQNLFYMTMTITVFAPTEDRLKDAVRMVISSSGQCTIKPMVFQQEFCFNTSLPLCRNDLTVEILNTTKTASVFIPFNTTEIQDSHAIFYGVNQNSGNMILYDRLKGDNYNGLYIGSSGSGKSFAAKCEMVSVLLSRPTDQVFVIDPQGEYAPLVECLDGQEIRLAPGNGVFVNPFDVNLLEGQAEGQDPITLKSDYIINLVNIMSGKRGLTASEESLLDRLIKKLYTPYVEECTRLNLSYAPDKAPTLTDLYRSLSLIANENFEARQLMDILAKYTSGSFNTFGRRTNVNTQARFIVYNTKSLGTNLKELGLYVCLNDVWTRLISNSQQKKWTWLYVDEFHTLLESPGTTTFLKRIWTMARKWLGVPTGIMQSTEMLMRDDETMAIFNTTNFMLLMKQAFLDRQNLESLLDLSELQLSYITESPKGTGLIYTGKIILPFEYKFPTDTELYKALTTSHDV